MITLYSTGCPQCRVLEAKLDAAHIQYIVDENVEEMQAKGFTTMPTLEVDGNIMNFMEAIKWVNEYAN
jgi:glutaredoxin